MALWTRGDQEWPTGLPMTAQTGVWGPTGSKRHWATMLRQDSWPAATGAAALLLAAKHTGARGDSLAVRTRRKRPAAPVATGMTGGLRAASAALTRRTKGSVCQASSTGAAILKISPPRASTSRCMATSAAMVGMAGAWTLRMMRLERRAANSAAKRSGWARAEARSTSTRPTPASSAARQVRQRSASVSAPPPPSSGWRQVMRRREGARRPAASATAPLCQSTSLSQRSSMRRRRSPTTACSSRSAHRAASRVWES